MTDPADTATGDTSPDHSRSGDDVADAIRVAEQGSSVSAVHDRGTENTTGDAPVERVRDDPEMTEGQVVLGEGEPGRHRSAGPEQAGSSGAAQSQPGARISDRVAAGEEPPADPSGG